MNLNLAARMALLPGISARRIVHECAWLTSELVATEPARERLREWLEAGGMDRPAGNLRERVPYFGDGELLEPVVEAFARMAAPAADYVIENAAVFGVGWSANGWIAARVERPRVILLCGASRDVGRIRRTMLHEAAHCFLEPVPARFAPAIEDEDLNERFAAIPGGPKFQAERKRAVESRAECLAASWERNGERR